MAKTLVSDELWEINEPLLPLSPSHDKGGRPRVPDRNCLAGIIFVLKFGISWEMLPQETGCGSGMTCWRRLRDWQAAGVWDRIHQLLLARLWEAVKIDFRRAVAESSIVRAVGAGEATGPSPVHRGQPGTKHHVLVDAGGVPLVANIIRLNRHDVTRLLPMVDAIPPIKEKPGRPLSKPKPIGLMTAKSIVKRCAIEESNRWWRNEGRSMAAGWAERDGWRSEQSVGFIKCGDCASAKNVGSTFIKALLL